MKKTKHFNISVPELGDVPDITQVSNAISDLEDATAGTLEIMKSEMQGTKITLTSVSRKTKRTGYYEGMSIRFKSPQDIEPNYLKTISVDGLGDQTLSVGYKVNRNEYIDIVYEGNKFTAYPVVVQKTDSVSENSSILVGTAKGVKTAYDKGVDALNKANQAQSSANNAQSTADGKVSKSGDTMTGSLFISSSENPSLIMKYQNGQKAVFNYNTTYKHLTIHNVSAKQEIRLYDDGDVNIDAKNLSTSSKEVVAAINELNSGKVSKNGDTVSGNLKIKKPSDASSIDIYSKNESYGSVTKDDNGIKFLSSSGASSLVAYDNGDLTLSNNINRSNIKLEGKNISISTEGIIDLKSTINSSSYNFTYALNNEDTGVGRYAAFGSLKSSPQNTCYGSYWSNNLENTEYYIFEPRRKQGIFPSCVLVNGDFASGFSIYAQTDISKQMNIKTKENCEQVFIANQTGVKAYSKSLTTSNKEVVSAINELNSKIASHCPYTVGDIYITTRSENPSTIWLGTTWERVANGRTLVGVDEGQSEFNTVMKQGGEKTHTLTINEIPSHNHSYIGAQWYDEIVAGAETERGGLDTAKTTGNTGGGQAHNNLQPYLTVYYWKRIR